MPSPLPRSLPTLNRKRGATIALDTAAATYTPASSCDLPSELALCTQIYIPLTDLYRSGVYGIMRSALG